MEVKVDVNGLIVAFAVVGQIDGGQQVTGEVPANFIDEFQPNKFKLIECNVVKNPDYVAPVAMEPVLSPSTEQEALTAVAQQMADQQQHIDSLESALTAIVQGGTK